MQERQFRERKLNVVRRNPFSSFQSHPKEGEPTEAFITCSYVEAVHKYFFTINKNN